MSDVIRHLTPTQQLSLSICAGRASSLPSLQHAVQGCKPQSVKSCGPWALRFTNSKACHAKCQFCTCVLHKEGCKMCLLCFFFSEQELKQKAYKKRKQMKVSGGWTCILKRSCCTNITLMMNLWIRGSNDMVFGLDKAPDQIKRLLPYWKLTVINQATMTQYFLQDEMMIHKPNKLENKCMQPSNSQLNVWYCMLCFNSSTVVIVCWP